MCKLQKKNSNASVRAITFLSSCAVIILCFVAWRPFTIFGITICLDSNILIALFTGLAWVAVLTTLLVQWEQIRESKETTRRVTEAQEKYAQIIQVDAQLRVLKEALENSVKLAELMPSNSKGREMATERGNRLQDLYTKTTDYLLSLDLPTVDSTRK